MDALGERSILPTGKTIMHRGSPERGSGGAGELSYLYRL